MREQFLNRENYLRQFAAWIGKPVIKVITGQRRVGKSKFMLQVMQHIKKADKQANIIYINTEEEEFQHIRDYKTLQKEINSKLSKKSLKIFARNHKPGIWESAFDKRQLSQNGRDYG